MKRREFLTVLGGAATWSLAANAQQVRRIGVLLGFAESDRDAQSGLRTGDGVLIEFISAVDAARCAVEIQRGMRERNAGVPPEKRIELRIGVHVGDIMIEDDDIFGDGVNIAARLEGIAQPGGICISDDAYRQVRGKLDVSFQDSGEQEAQEYRAAGARLSGTT